MEKEELEKRIEEISKEIRMCADEYLDSTKDVKEIDERCANLKKELQERKKELAQLQLPKEAKSDSQKTVWRSIADAMVEHRAVTLSGTGVINTLKELVQSIVSRTDVLEGVRIFYGRDAATKIPVWGTQLKADFVSEGSTGTAKTNTAGVTSIDAYEILSSLPVTDMMLDLGAANLAEELPLMFEGAISNLLADGMCNGKTITVGNETITAMTGIFKATGATAFTGKATMVKLAEFARNMKSKTYKNPCIYMSNTVYSKFLSDTSTDETTKLYKECVIREKMIEDVKIKLTDFATTSGSGTSGAWATGDVLCVGMDAENYAIGMAGQLKIKQKETASATFSTFDATAYAGGKPILASDVNQFKFDAT